MWNHLLRCLAIAFLTATSSAGFGADPATYPSRPIHIIISFPAGTATDTLARTVGLKLDVPTVAESGYPGFDVSSWHSILAPAGTPPEIVERLNHELVRIIASRTYGKS